MEPFKTPFEVLERIDHFDQITNNTQNKTTTTLRTRRRNDISGSNPTILIACVITYFRPAPTSSATFIPFFFRHSTLFNFRFENNNNDIFFKKTFKKSNPSVNYPKEKISLWLLFAVQKPVLTFTRRGRKNYDREIGSKFLPIIFTYTETNKKIISANYEFVHPSIEIRWRNDHYHQYIIQKTNIQHRQHYRHTAHIRNTERFDCLCRFLGNLI